MGRSEVLDTIALADCAIEIEATDLDDLFVTAARALAETMVDPTTAPAVVDRTVELSARSLDLLLFDWLSELVYLKDAEQLVFVRTDVHVREQHRWCLTARLAGARLDPARVVLRADVKAVTLHEFRVERAAHGWRARVVLDI